MNVQEAYRDTILEIFNSDALGDFILTITSQAFERVMASIGGTLTLIGTVTDNNKFLYAGGIITLIAPFLAIVQVSKIRNKLVELYNLAQENRKEFGSLLGRVETINYALKPLLVKQQQNYENFRQQEYYRGIIRLIDTIKKIKIFLEEVSRLKAFRKFIHVTTIKEKQEMLNKELDYNIKDLSFALSIVFEKTRERDQEEMLGNISEMDGILARINNSIVSNREDV